MISLWPKSPESSHDSIHERQVPPEWRLFLYHNWATHWKTSCLNKMVTYQRLSRFGTTISIQCNNKTVLLWRRANARNVSFRNSLRWPIYVINSVKYVDLAKPKSGARIFFPHVSRAQRLAPARTRTRVFRLGAQCTDHRTTGQSRGVGVPAVQLTTYVKSGTLYRRPHGHKSKFFRLDGLLPFCIIMGLRSASSAIKPNYLVVPSPTPHHCFFGNVPP